MFITKFSKYILSEEQWVLKKYSFYLKLLYPQEVQRAKIIAIMYWVVAMHHALFLKLYIE